MQKSVTEERYKFIGGSDIPVIMGISPYKTRYQLLREKAQLDEPEEVSNPYTEYGNVMEDKIRKYVNKHYAVSDPFKEGKHQIDCEPIGIRCHTDGENEEAILEIKTTSQVYDNVNDYKLYLVQLLFYMYNANKPKGILAVYLRPDDMSERFNADRLQIWHIEDHDYEELMKEILVAVEDFKSDLQLMQLGIATEEEDFLPAEVVEASHAIFALENQLAEMERIEEEVKAKKKELCRLMAEYGVKTWVTPNGTRITHVAELLPREDVVQEFDEEAFKAEHPKTYNKYVKPKTVKKSGKAAYVQITKPKKGK